MALNAFKDGTIVNEAGLNSLLAMQNIQLLYDGAQRAAKIGSGATANNVANYSYCTRFSLTGSTEIGRVELDVSRSGNGADLVVQIRSGMSPASGVDGTLLKQVIVPGKFIPTMRTYWSVPIGLAGLTNGGQYWLVVQRAGDATNRNDWTGEAAQDAIYPAYSRAGSTGVWTANNALHFKIFSGEFGELKHSIYGGTGFTTIEYSGEAVSKVYRYLPPADGSAGGIRDVMTYTWSGEYLKDGVVG